MDAITRTHVQNIHSPDRELQNAAYSALMQATDQLVEWAYEVWDELLADLQHKDNHVRAIAAQLLSNLAKSDPQQRILKDFDALLAVTKDDRFVTARHCLQSLWKIGVVGAAQRQKYVDGLAHRFQECASEKNCTLIRSDIIQSLKDVYEVVLDAAIKDKALQLIDTELDLKYRKKYMTVWKVKSNKA